MYYIIIALTDALVRVSVVHVAAVARAVEASRRVNARPVVAHVRHQRALVDFFGPVRHGVHDQTRSRTAQQQVFLLDTRNDSD